MKEVRRLFVAIWPTEGVVKSLATGQVWLKDRLPPRLVRWTPPGHMHLTLCFMGDVPAGSVDPLIQALKSLPPAPTLPRLSLANPGVFPSPDHPRILWAGVRGDTETLSVLRRHIAQAVAPFSTATVESNFRPHLTLGRLAPCGQRETRLVMEGIKACRFPTSGPWKISGCTLMESDRHPDGPRYTALKEIPWAATR